MNAYPQVTTAAASVSIIVAGMLALGLVFPALANPVALGLGTATSVAFTFRGRMPLGAPQLRVVVAVVALAMAALVWASLQPGYIGA